MENIVYKDYTYNNIYVFNNQIIKYSKLNEDLWHIIKEKNLIYINTPTEVLKVDNDSIYHSKIYLPYLNNYKTLYDESYTINYNTKEILLLLKKTLQIIKDMHKNNIIHGDISSDNIMINEDLDIKFIDLDEAIVNDSEISKDNIYYSYSYCYNRKRSLTRIQDKIDILDIFMNYLVYGNFKKDISYTTDIKSLNLQKYIKEEINAYLNRKSIPNRNYYFIDIINELLASNFESKILEKRGK